MVFKSSIKAQSGGAGGTVTSVAMTTPTGLSVAGSPITTSGTLAVSLTSGYVIPTQATLDGLVPYTGATQDVDLGDNNLDAKAISVTGTNGNGHIHLKHQSANAAAAGSSTVLFADSNGDIKYKNDGGFYTTFATSANTADRSYTFPNATGNLAFKSALVADRIAYTSDANTVSSLDTATYPSLTELSYVKGVTSAIQTQLNAKQSTVPGLLPLGTSNKFPTVNSGGTALEFVYSANQNLQTVDTVTFANLSGTNTGDVTLSGENYLSRTGQVITANAVNLSNTNVTGTLAAARFPALTGDVTNTAGSLATTIANDAVTFAKMQNVASGVLLGRSSAGTGDIETQTLGSFLSFSGSALTVTPPTASSGSSVLGSSYVVTVNATWENTGLSIVLPLSGATYLVYYSAEAQVSWSAGANGVIATRLFNATTSAEVSGTASNTVYEQNVNFYNIASTSKIVIVTTASANNTIRLQAGRFNATAWNAAGHQVNSASMGFVRLA